MRNPGALLAFRVMLAPSLGGAYGVPSSFLLTVLLALAPGQDEAVPETCSVTLSTDTSFVPPFPYTPLAPIANRFWYGTDELWAMPASDGVWRGVESPEGVYNKVFCWSTRWDWRTDHQPDLSVTVQALDGSVSPVTMHGATNAHNKDDIKHAMLVAVGLPTRGCWQITGECKEQSLSYVVWVP